MKDVCVICGAEFVEGRGFVEPHYFPCFNERYCTAICDEVSDDWIRLSKQEMNDNDAPLFLPVGSNRLIPLS